MAPYELGEMGEGGELVRRQAYHTNSRRIIANESVPEARGAAGRRGSLDAMEKKENLAKLEKKKKAKEDKASLPV